VDIRVRGWSGASAILEDIETFIDTFKGSDDIVEESGLRFRLAGWGRGRCNKLFSMLFRSRAGDSGSPLAGRVPGPLADMTICIEWKKGLELGDCRVSAY
jgi:hypothetical protein